MTEDPRRHLGRLGEALALQHYERLGYALVARNHRTRHGELDLIVCDGRTLVFAEVKTRRASRHGPTPWDALHERKRRQVRAMASAWLADTKTRPRVPNLRFDGIGVVIDAHGHLIALDHAEDAF